MNDERKRLQAEVERLRMQLAACGVVAMANTPESAARQRDMHPDYMSASCQDVIRAVDREMALREERDQLKAEVERLREDNQMLRRQSGSLTQQVIDRDQERDQLKAAVALAIDTFEQYQMDVDTYPPIKHVALMRNLNGVLSKHDAEVIERCASMAEEWGARYLAKAMRQDINNQLRQQAKEVQT